ncbi:hypothetical protein NAP1_11298 [Erythrobacter sp. NAP1]|uniref:hypothetical protein n=1 Tax=Erythrobacter sp. NAP1 TaxID=237727 RepID=UPI00006876CC|nr:hypothetical protein [Erythrobacter sp. NAP1]EAQ28177.1 hypothetical protein NAP1_11298 [Erythrobacter sp. NAP1]
MMALPRIVRPALVLALAGTLSACAGTYTGPVEVTRFVSEQPAMLGQGTITLEFPDELRNTGARDAFASAVSSELEALGYTVVMDTASAGQIATIRTSRNPIEAADRGGPVSVGVGGGTGSFGSGVGVGVGINLGGGDRGPRVVTELSVRISGPGGESLWEGRAQQPISIKSPYADVDASARTLTAALFKDFPGGNGETVSIDVDELR